MVSGNEFIPGVPESRFLRVRAVVPDFVPSLREHPALDVSTLG
jgi:hypothetical protein